MKLTQKEAGALLYEYYKNNYMETDFCFDEPTTCIDDYCNKMKNKYSEDEIDEIRKNITCREEEGTDYDVLYFELPDFPDLFLQVTSLIDYNNNKAGNYTGNAQWADVGMFFIDYKDIDFNDLSDK